ncbi:MAG: hypothetical protein ACLT1O_05725 [Bifidobacterium pseudocatenulatum]
MRRRCLHYFQHALLGVTGMPFWIGVALVVVGSLINVVCATLLIVRFCRIGRLR